MNDRDARPKTGFESFGAKSFGAKEEERGEKHLKQVSEYKSKTFLLGTRFTFFSLLHLLLPSTTQCKFLTHT